MTTSINFHLSRTDKVNVRLLKYGEGEMISYPYALVELSQGNEDLAIYVHNSDEAIEIAAAFARAATHLRDRDPGEPAKANPTLNVIR